MALRANDEFTGMLYEGRWRKWTIECGPEVFPPPLAAAFANLLMPPQMSVKAFESNVATFKESFYLSEYNEVFEYMLREHFLKLTDFTILLDSDYWQDEDGKPGASPFDATFSGRDLLSSKTLEYWDFLVSNLPWFNAISSQALDDAKTIAKVHDKQSSIIRLENVLARCASRKMLGLSAGALQLQEPAKRRRVMWREAKSPPPGETDASKQP